MTNHKLRRTIENHDFYAGAKFFRLWWLLAIHDIRSRYRGSVLGPFWITLTTIVMVSSVGFLFGAIFKQNPETYLPMFAFGLIFWHFISANVAEESNFHFLCKRFRLFKLTIFGANLSNGISKHDCTRAQFVNDTTDINYFWSWR